MVVCICLFMANEKALISEKSDKVSLRRFSGVD